MTMRIKIDEEVYVVSAVREGGYLAMIETESGEEFYLAEDSESAGKATRKYWEDMKNSDPKEFRRIIGDERLIQWACGESDSFGISSFNDFLDTVETVPEEEFASYDGSERSVDRVGKLRKELGFTPTVAYRYN